MHKVIINRRATIAAFFLLLTFQFSQAQDSLKSILKHSSDYNIKSEVHGQIGMSFLSSNFDSALYHFNQMLVLGLNNGNDTIVGNAKMSIAKAYIYMGNYDHALSQLIDAEEIFSKIKMWDELIRIESNRGTIRYRNNEHDLALNHYNEANRLLDQKQEEVNRYDFIKGTILGNIAVIHENKKKYDEALKIYFEAMQHNKKAGSYNQVAVNVTNIGINYMRQDKLALSIQYLQEGLEMRDSLEDQYGQSRSCIYMSHVLMLRHLYDSAERMAKKGIEIAKQINSPETISFGLDELSQINRKQEKYQKAIESLIEAKVITDSMNQIGNQRKFDLIEKKYEVKLNEAHRDLELRKQSRIYIICAFVLILMLLYILFLLYKSRSEATKKRIRNESLVKVNEALSKEVEYKNKELTTNIVYLMEKNELLNDVSDQLVDLKNDSKIENKKLLQKIIQNINTNKDSDIWQMFEASFLEIYNEFYEKLNKVTAGTLTSNERKLCAFLKLNLSTKEICKLTGQLPSSLDVARGRLRKKIGLAKTGEEISTYLNNL
ncbi:MAG: tetratricopeptide repeat protein [Reichenbachiella sp.]